MKLSDAIALVGKVVPKRGPLPVLSNVRMSCAWEGVTLEAQNGDTCIRCLCHMPGSVEGADWVALVPFTDLKAVAKMKAPVLTFDPLLKNLVVTSEEGKAEIPCGDPLDYPDFPKPLEGESLTLLAGQIPAALAQVKHAVANEITRYALNGVLLEVDKKGSRLVASDEKRLAMSEMGGTNAIEWRAIFPVLALDCVPKDRDVSVRVEQEECTDAKTGVKSRSGNYVRAEIVGSDFRIFTRLVDGNFPDCASVIPTERKVVVSVDRKAFLEAMKAMVAVTKNEGSPTVKLVGTNCHVTVTAAPLTGQRAERVLVVRRMNEIEGPYSIILNPRYLVDMCAATKAQELILDFKDQTTPVIARALLGNPEWLELVMPITIDV